MPAPPVGINFRKIAVDKSKNIQYNSKVEKRISRCGSVWVAARVRDAGQQIRPRPVDDAGRICWRSGRRLARRFTRRRQSREPQEGRAGSEFLFQPKEYRDVAQFGRALRSGRRGRRFESCHLDQKQRVGICLPSVFLIADARFRQAETPRNIAVGIIARFLRFLFPFTKTGCHLQFRQIFLTISPNRVII